MQPIMAYGICLWMLTRAWQNNKRGSSGGKMQSNGEGGEKMRSDGEGGE